MTHPLADEAKALDINATPGPWRVYEVRETLIVADTSSGTETIARTFTTVEGDRGDASLITRARTLLVEMADMIERLTDVNAVLCAAVEAFARMPDAGLTSDDPRWHWWNETADARLEALAAGRATEGSGT